MAVLLWICFSLALLPHTALGAKDDDKEEKILFEGWQNPYIPALDGAANFSEIIPENPFDGEKIQVVVAPGAETLEIIEQDIDNYLSIDENGTITVNSSLGNLDMEVSSSYTLVVRATQDQTPPKKKDDEDDPKQVIVVGTATLTIFISDVNDEAPQFSKTEYFHGLTQGTAERTVLDIMTATDPDVNPENTHVYYSIVGGNTHDDFYISPRSGRLSVAVGHTLNSTVPAYALLVTATDSGFPTITSTVTVFVGVC